MNRKMSFLGKQMSVTLAALLVMTGLASAGLLTYYGQMTLTATVEQSILVDGQDYDVPIIHEIPEPAPGGEIFCFKHKLLNQMSVPGAVSFETTYGEPLEGSEIVTTYYDLREEISDGDDDASIGQRGMMTFSGTLTDESGEYSGTIGADHSFDLYAEQGSCAYVQDYYGSGDWNCEGTDTFEVGYYGSEYKDAYPSGQGGGPWGTFYDPDVEDAGYDPTHYALHLDAATDTWELWYVDASLNQVNEYAPLSGEINWDTMILLESQKDWKQQWTWGFERIELGHPAWDIVITDMGGGNYEVTLTPVGKTTSEMTLMPGEADDFAICYAFDKTITSGSYIITTDIVPVTS